MDRHQSRRMLALFTALAVLTAWPTQGRTNLGHEYETEHYTISTDISADYAHLVARHMEEIFEEYTRRFSGLGEMRRKFDVVVYASRESYDRAVPESVRGSTGVFIAHKRLLAAHAGERTTEEVLRTLYHEGFHQFMWEAISRDPPAWLNEGVAEYFAEATWNGRKFQVGLVPTMRVHTVREAIREGTYIPLDRLFSMDSDQWLQTMQMERRRASLYYSQSWSIIHFLAHAEIGRYSHMLNAYVRDLANGRKEPEAFVAAFGDDLAAFEREWARYVMELEPSEKFRCRDNIEAILLLARVIYTDPTDFKKIDSLRNVVLRERRYRWQITRPTGEVLTSEDTDRVARLFRCPHDQEGHGISYGLVRKLADDMPIVVCDHHPGVVILGYYEREASGGFRPVIEEQVRETLRPDLRRAIEVATHR